MSRVSVADHMVVSAVRYALGRQTYIVPVTTQEVMRVWPELSAKTKTIIRRDIKEALPRCPNINRLWWEDVLRLDGGSER